MTDLTPLVVFVVLIVSVGLVAAILGFGAGYMHGHDDGWDEAANMPPSQLETAKRLMAMMRRDRR